ncbi:Nucleic acid-binding OB-fold [Penicillium canescens]|nr:Nucleic acid-binding OB-fold [Penicillium canescens]
MEYARQDRPFTRSKDNLSMGSHCSSPLPSTKTEEDLSDLLDTHQDRPTEVRRRDQVKIITTPWTKTQTL